MRDRYTLVALAGLTALAVAMGIGRFAFTPILPMMQTDAGVSVAQGGWLASANYIGYLAGALTAVALRMTPARAIRLGLAAVGLSTLAMGFTDSMSAWLLLRAVAGVASAWVLVFASAWCLEQFQAQAAPGRSPILGATVFAGVGFGIAVAGALCAALATAHATSASAWIALGAVALIAAAAIWNGFGAQVQAPPADAAMGNRRNGEALRMILCYGAFGFGYIIPATFLAAMAREAFPDPAVYAWSWPIFGAAAAASPFVAALLLRRVADRWIWILGHLAMAAGVIAPLAIAGLPGIIVCALLVGGTFMVVTMAGIQEARRVAGPRARALIAAMTAAFAAGQIAGPLLVSAMAYRHAGYAPALTAAGVLLVASALALIPHPSRTRSP